MTAAQIDCVQTPKDINPHGINDGSLILTCDGDQIEVDVMFNRQYTPVLSDYVIDVDGKLSIIREAEFEANYEEVKPKAKKAAKDA